MAGTAAQSPAESRDSRLRQDETFLRRAFHRSLLPCVLSILSENINILADGVLVGQRIGTDGLSAISLCVPVYLVLCVVFTIVPALLDSLSGRLTQPGISDFSPPLFLFVYVAPVTLVYSAFGFLTRRNASDFYHSLPLTRE